MLTFFPTPYPHEWWYSVLCRYHVRTGNSKQQTTVKELFPGRTTAAIGSVYPNSTIAQVVSQLPSGILDAEDVITQHTLFPYFTRFNSFEKKQDAIQKICAGETIVITSLRRFSDLSEWQPRYCPLCAEADRATHGEAYWHVDHQIPLMHLCPQHGCRLLPAEQIKQSHVDYTFFALEMLPLSASVDTTALDWELPIARILADYQWLPLEAAATPGHSNLATAISNMGYGVIQAHSPNTLVDARRLYINLCDFYGRELVSEILGGESSICTINRILKWKMVTPERYALLQCFAGITSELLFSHVPLLDACKENLMALRDSPITLTKLQVQEALGVTASQLGILVKKYAIPPFWRLTGQERDSNHRRKISFSLNDNELEVFKRALKKSGYRYDSHFARHCIMQYIAENFDGK